MSDQTSIWSWVYKDMNRLQEEGGLQETIANQYREYMQLADDDPIGAELAITAAIDAAKAANEPSWQLHLRHWRLQHWQRNGEIKRMLPEAIDLLDLAVDERVKDIPQRICAYHDVVECYVEMDPAGYYQEIKENSEHILSQLPQRHSCADCARSHLARAAAATGQTEEAERWLAQHASCRYDKGPETFMGLGASYLRLQQWEQAESHYQQANKSARGNNQRLSAFIGIARARIGKKDLDGLAEILFRLRQGTKYESGSALLADMLEIEGLVAELHQVPQAALNYFVHAARLKLELGFYRIAAEIALHAAEIAREKGIAEDEETLEIAALAVGMLPPASEDLYQRLAALGKEPAAAQEQQPEGQLTAEQLKETEERKELASLEALLQAHMQSGNLPGITVALFRLAIWYEAHRQNRAAVDYFIWSAALERLGKFSQRERADALGGLKHMGKKLPAGAVEGALRAAESAPPSQLLPLLNDVPATQWQWTIQAIATEVTDKPVVEPEPINKDARVRFQRFIDTSAGLAALFVRFQGRIDPVKLEMWVHSAEQSLQKGQERLRENPDEKGAKEFISYTEGLTALARGVSIEEVQSHVLEPYNQIIAQIGKNAAKPIWQHPGNAPLDLMIEKAAQRTVKALRIQDEHRAERLNNLALRYELMAIDLHEQEKLQSMARFLDALVALVQNDGKALPTSEPPLEEPYAAILTAVFQAGQEHTVSHDEEEDE